MSVLKNKRQPGKLQVVVKAREVAVYTTQILNNEKCFPKRSRWIIAQSIADEAVGILACCRRANAVSVMYDTDYKYGRQQQIQAYSMCEALLTKIEIAHGLYGIETRRVECWVGLIVETETLLRKWILSDEKRYKDTQNDS